MDDGSALDERWLPVVGFDGLYDVSDLGRIRSYDRIVYAGRGRTRRQAGRILKPSSDPDGRQIVSLSSMDGKKRKIRVHSLVLGAFVGPRPDGLEGCHNNGDASDNRLINLRWDTKSSNMLDCVRHGTDPQRRRTHCPRGHLLVPPNLIAYRSRVGHRLCLSCRRAEGNRRRAAERGEVLDVAIAADRHYAKLMGLPSQLSPDPRDTHCRAGLHRWDEQSPFIDRRGNRECRPCRNARQGRNYAARKAQ